MTRFDPQTDFGLPKDVSKTVLSFLADAIVFANGENTQKWGLTNKLPKRITFNVGFTEIISVRPNDVRLIVDRSVLERHTFAKKFWTVEFGESAKGYYPSVRDSVCLTPTYDGIRKQVELFRSVFHHLKMSIQISSKNGFSAGVRDGHSPDMVANISLYLNRDLPQPSFASHGDNAVLMEGALTRVVSSIHERNEKARRSCIEHYGSSCQVCSFSFSKRYGNVGDGFIHVHHVKPISASAGKYVVDPIRDLIPVCPNCHAMLHRQDPPLVIEELRNSLK